MKRTQVRLEDLLLQNHALVEVLSFACATAHHAASGNDYCRLESLDDLSVRAVQILGRRRARTVTELVEFMRARTLFVKTISGLLPEDCNHPGACFDRPLRLDESALVAARALERAWQRKAARVQG